MGKCVGGQGRARGWRWHLDIWAKKKAIGLVFVLLPGIASADGLWAVFEARCLAPFEAFSAPVTDGLTRGDGGLWAGDGVLLRVTEESCAVLGDGAAGLAERLAGRAPYEEVAPGVWQSDRWREPRLEVEATEDGYAVRETDLES